VLVEVVVEALFFSEVFECVGDFGAVVAVAGDDTMTTLSPLVFFFLLVEDFDCVGDFGATVVAEAGDFFFESFFFLEDFHNRGLYRGNGNSRTGTDISRHCRTSMKLTARLLSWIGGKKRWVTSWHFANCVQYKNG